MELLSTASSSSQTSASGGLLGGQSGIQLCLPDGNTDIALRSVLGSQRHRTRRRRKHPSEQATQSGHRRVQQQTLKRHQSCSTSLEAAFSAELPRR
eukprot:1923033-Pleurochrysis_carterae.AAC.1